MSDLSDGIDLLNRISNDTRTLDADVEADSISKEVDENGEPLPEEDQKSARRDKKDDWYYKHTNRPTSRMANFRPKFGVDEVTEVWKEKAENVPYCPVYFETNASGGRDYTAYISGMVEDVDEYLDLIDILMVATVNDTMIIYHDSPGGYVSSGGHIASAIARSAAKVTSVARGMCASADSLILSACSEIVVGDFALLMYHMSSHFDYGNSLKIAERAHNQVRYVNECLLSRALEHGHITQDEFDRIQNGEDVFVPAKEFRSRLANRSAK